MIDLRAALAIGRAKYEAEKKLKAQKITGSTGSSGYVLETTYEINSLDKAAPEPVARLEPVLPVLQRQAGTAGTGRSNGTGSVRLRKQHQEKQQFTSLRTGGTAGTGEKHGCPEKFNIPADPPEGFSLIQWASIKVGAQTFASEWGEDARARGWAEDELFGLHPTRVDRRGLAFLLHAGDRVVALDEDGADILTASGARQRFYRRPVGTNA